MSAFASRRAHGAQNDKRQACPTRAPKFLPGPCGPVRNDISRAGLLAYHLDAFFEHIHGYIGFRFGDDQRGTNANSAGPAAEE